MTALTETQETPSHKPHSEREQKTKYLRLTQIVEYIKTHPLTASAKEMSKIFEVSQRTIQRDIERLNYDFNADIVLNSKTWRYELKNPDFMLQNALIPEGEFVAITAILPLLERYKGSPLEKHLINAYNTIQQILPKEIEAPVSIASQIQFLSDPLPNIETEVFESIFSAIRQHKIITFDYKSISATKYSPHEAHPYRIYNQKGDWYCVCWYPKRDCYTSFNLARMKNIALTEEYKPDPKYEENIHIDPNFGIWNNPKKTFKVEVEFIKEINTYILERTWHINQKCRQNKDGSVYLSFESNQEEEVIFWILKFGSKVKVLSPDWLKDKIRDEHQKSADLYKN